MVKVSCSTVFSAHFISAFTCSHFKFLCICSTFKGVLKCWFAFICVYFKQLRVGVEKIVFRVAYSVRGRCGVVLKQVWLCCFIGL